jgi:hypothetical protein
MKSLASIDHGVCNQALIETRQLTVVCASERQEITIRDAGGIQKSRRIHILLIKQRYLIGPKCMARQFSQGSQNLGYGRRRTGRIRVSGMADDSQYSVFGQRAGGPGMLSFGSKPLVCPVVLNVRGIDQGNQYIDIQQKSCQGNSSRS